MLAAVCGSVWRWGVVPSWHENPDWIFGSLDLTAYFYPKWVYGTSAILSGRIPLWNPLEFCGTPFLATAQVAALYPVKNLIFALFPPAQALEIHTVVHFILAAGCEYAYCRWIGVGPAAGVIAALTWAFSPPMMQAIGHPTQLMCLCWVPLIVLTYERALMRRTVGAAAMAGAVLALQMMAGYPLFSVSTGLVLGVWTVGWLAREDSFPSAVRTTTAAIGAAAFMVAFSAPQALPLGELAPETTRAELVSAWAGDPNLHLGALVPGMISFVGRLLGDPLGALPVIGLLVGVGTRRWLLLAGAIFCSLAPGALNPVVRLLPGIHDARYLPPIFHGLLPFFAATLAGVGLDRVLAAPRRAWPWLAALCVARSVLITSLPAGWELSLAGRIGAIPDDIVRSMAPVVAAGIPPAAWLPPLFTDAVVVAALARRRLPALIVTMAIAGASILGALDFYWAGQLRPYPRNPPEPQLEQVARGFAPGGRMTSDTLMWDGELIMSGVPNVAGYEGSLHPRRVGRLLEAAGLEGRPVLGGVDWSVVAEHEPLADLIALAGVIAGQPIAQPTSLGFGSPLQLASHRFLYRHVRPRGRAFVVHEARSATSEEEAFASVTAPTFRPRQEVVVEGLLPPTEPTRIPSTAKFVEDAPEDVLITTSTAAAGILVLADAWFPGWEARLDDRPVPILRVDYAFRGVAVPQGKHRIEFRYRSRSFWIGVALATISAMIAFGFTCRPSRPSSRKPRSA